MPQGRPGFYRGAGGMARNKGALKAHGAIANQCYSHLGGRLGKVLMEHLLKLGWLEPIEDKRFRLTAKGRLGLLAWGIPPEAMDAGGPR